MDVKFKTASDDRAIYGVCGGISKKLGVPSFLIRLLFVLTLPVSLLVYFVLANYVFEDGYL